MRFATIIRAISAFSALLLVSSLAVLAGPPTPAFAALGDPGGLTLAKQVNLESAITGVEPGETFTYDIVVGCDDNDCIDAVLVDELPDEFAGFTLSTVSVTGAPPTEFDLQLTGGCTENAALTPGCGIEVDFLQPLGDLGGEPQFGIVAGTTFRITYSLTAPLTLTPDWPHDGVPVPNRADLTAINADSEFSIANVTVDVPVVVDALVTKTWNPNSQQYGPESPSTITTGIANTSNVDATSLVLQDPSIAVDAATELPTTNPFTRVDFTGLCGVTMPEGADLVQVDVYYEEPANSWNWVDGTPAAMAALPTISGFDAGKVGGLRVTFTSTAGDTIVRDGDAGTLCFTVEQRETDRTTGDPLVEGGVVENEVAGTVTVPNEDAVTRTATDTLDVTGLTVEVSAGKQITPTRVPASGEFTVNVTGKNDSNGTLSSFTISEPGTDPGTGPFLSDELTFVGFNSHSWPAGATGASLEWYVNGVAQTPIVLADGDPVPAPPTLGAGQYVTGFEVTYTGAINPEATAGWSFDVDTDAHMVDANDVSDTYTNTVGVSGTNAAGTDTAEASDDVIVFYPDIDIALNKTVSPDRNTPGGTAVVSLETTTSADSQYVRPTEIVVEDVWDDSDPTKPSFWDAYRAQEIVFTDVPAGSTLHIEYATGTPGSLTWQDLPGGVGVDDMIDSLAVPPAAVGLRFTYTKTTGFAQGTSVKPNIIFEAAGELRSDPGTPTDVAGEPATQYFNVATAQGEGQADDLTVTTDKVPSEGDIGIIIFENGTGPGPGSMLSSKRWVKSNWSTDETNLNSQSASTARTLLGWGVTIPGYDSVVISDAEDGSESTPGTTVYQAFNLTRIMPTTTSRDPLMKWDVVSSVELFDGTTWNPVTAPGGSWMNGSGNFRGHTLTPAQVANTTGVKITVEENTAARTASTDPTRPAPGSGVASSATERQMRLQWQLRNTLRVPHSSELKWVNEDVAYNVAGNGVVQNTFELHADFGGDDHSITASDDIALIDTLPNVNTLKTASTPWVTVPYFGDVAPGDYPTVDFTIEAWNAAHARASYLRSADPFPCTNPSDCITPASNHSPDIYSSKPYTAATNPFERFNLTGITFTTPAATNIDHTVSQVALWKRDASGALTVDQLSMADASTLTAGQLETVIGVSVVYQSTDPETTGGLIPRQDSADAHPTMTLHTQLRATLRSDPGTDPVTDPGTLVTSGVTVENTAHAQSFDPVLTPSPIPLPGGGDASTPNASDEATVELRAAGLDVTASKTITPGTIIEANPAEPITVVLGATDGASTLGAETATIRDVDAGFWSEFRFTGLGTVTLPAGADRVRVDVQLNGSATWVQGVPDAVAALPAAVTDFDEITGIQFVFDRSDGKPFSDTVPSAGWNASATFTAVLRDGAVFPGSVDNEIMTIATHDTYEDAESAAADDVTLSTGTAQIDVRKEALTGNTTHITEPGVDIPWTLEFTNTGTGYLDISSVNDSYDSHLQWDGNAPTYATSTGGTLPTSGIVVTQPATGELEFTWPGTARMQPGETFVVTLKFSLLPGLASGERATNEFTVNTVQTLTSCTNGSGNGQGTLLGLGSEQCGTSNYVQPQSGALLFAQKSVKGEVDGTLVDGAVNTVDPNMPCVADADGFFRSKCAARTVVGATDTWRLIATNSGTVGYSTVTVVDVLPNIGDRLLATGAPRGSGFRPVLKDVAAPGTETVPAGATTVWEVSTDPQACVGGGPGSNWGTNPTCSTTTWTTGSSYAGNPEDITAVRWTVDLAASAGGVLAPGGTVELRFDMVNTPLATTDAISVAVPVGDQIAWNQFGVVATPTTGAVIRRAPVQAGVLAEPAVLGVAKNVEGVAASHAPSSFGVALVCTVPDGAAGTVPVDMGTFGALSVPGNGLRQVDGIPLGAECEVTETNAGGATSTSMDPADGVIQVAQPGILIPAATVTITNVFDSSFLAFTGADGVLIGVLFSLAFLFLFAGILVTVLPRIRQRHASN